MSLENINLNTLKVFSSVYKGLCMTAASKKLNLTQSGVSQHIKSLEDSLGTLLFDRVNRKIIPTHAGNRLYQTTRPIFEDIQQALVDISQKKLDDSIQGQVNIGMPIEFGNSFVIPQLAVLSQKHPYLNFGLRMGYAKEMNEMLLKRTLDLAFVDNYSMDGKIHLEKVSEETLKLCVSQSYLERFGLPSNTKSFFESLDYVAYESGEPFLRSWFSHHIRRKNLRLRVRAYVMDVQGIARFIINGIGVGVIPHHLVKKLLFEGHNLHLFEGSGYPLKNPLRLAYLKNRSRSPALECVLAVMRAGL